MNVVKLALSNNWLKIEVETLHSRSMELLGICYRWKQELENGVTDVASNPFHVFAAEHCKQMMQF